MSLSDKWRDGFENINFLRGHKNLPEGNIYMIQSKWVRRYDLVDQEPGYIEWLFPLKTKKTVEKKLESYPLTDLELNVFKKKKFNFLIKLKIS